MEGKQFQFEGMSSYTREVVKNNYEQKRIVADPVFHSLYSDYEKDMEKASELKKYFSEHSNDLESLGADGEALIFTCIDKGALGSNITARGTNIYDDYYHGADMVIESSSKQLRDPIVSAIDVTLNQRNINTVNKSAFEGGKVEQEIGFEKKLERIKRHIDYLASMSDNYAVELSAWIQRGGLTEKRSNLNAKKFDDAERLMSLKYYKNPKNSEDPDRPHFVSGGPQIVVSVDNMFVNKVFSTEGEQQKKSVDGLSSLLQVEVPMSIAVLKEYVEKIAIIKRSKNVGTNLFFASYRAACLAWEETFSNEQYQFRLEKAIKECNQNPDLRAQLQYFQRTLQKSFGI